MTNVDELLNENKNNVRETLIAARNISNRLDTSSIELEQSIRRINQLVQSDTIGEILAGARDVAVKLRESDIQKLILDMGKVAQQTNQLLLQLNQDLDQGSQEFIEGMMLLRSTLENLEEASQMINDDPSILIRGTKIKDEPDKHLTDD
jgi:phospholipid/cholesterol/gamma-HCH transport system substrate-binding protein